MMQNQIEIKINLKTKRYLNGQLAVFVQEISGEPLAELSLMNNSVELEEDEFILKDYTENKELVNHLIKLKVIKSINRFVLIGSHLCPICQIASES